MSAWDEITAYFADGYLPYSEYLWMVPIVCISLYALYKAKKMVSEI